MTSHTREPISLPFPLPRTHTGFALGNGNFGALVWGKDRICITVNRADWWDHRGGELLVEGTKYADLVARHDPNDVTKVYTGIRGERRTDVGKTTRLPAGRFELVPREGLKPSHGVLHLEAGRLEIHWAQSESQRPLWIILDAETNSLIVEDPGATIAQVVARPAWDWVGDYLQSIGFLPPEILEGADAWGWSQDVPEDPAMAVFMRRAPGGFVLAAELGDDAPQAMDAARATARAIVDAGFAPTVERTAAWWRAYWDRAPEIALPDPFFTRFFDMALFKFGAATSPLSTHPAGLQGPWVEEYQMPPWSADYHVNVNIQQIYTLAFSANQLEHLIPLFDMLESDTWQQVMHDNARILFGIDDGLLITHAPDDRARQCGGLHADALFDFATTGWLAQLYWLYYTHSLDETFLSSRALPFMRGAMRVYEASMEEHDGRLSIALSRSAEYTHTFPDGREQKLGRDPSNQLACTHMLADALLETARILGRDPEPFWQRVRDELPPWCPIGEGEERIAIWEGQDLAVCHRHHSHLAGIYPFDTLDLSDPKTAQVVENSVDHWILKGMGQWSEWCIPWAAIIHARLGMAESPRTLLNMWRDVYVNRGLTTVYLPRFTGITAHRRADIRKPRETNEIMQLDGTMGGATALLEMMVHTHSGSTRVFPALSEKWPDASFRNVLLPGAFRVSATREDGATRDVRIHSRQGGTIRVDVPDHPRMMLCQAGRTREVALPVTIKMAAGEDVGLSEA